ncbi:MAG: tRNA pseudouridine(55) synthase TruB [Phycisphaera sp.]|nr:MAG: tRNA pseudouridine(55) synthase TruB [Phycisphaera sp.]
MAEPSPKPKHDPEHAHPAPVSGLLVIDKPEGPSSMHACARVRSALRRGGAPKRVKVGHGGTLDPLATGLLVILCGKATPLCNRVMIGKKQYRARVDLSAFTTTDDREGERTEVVIERPPTKDRVLEALGAFVGDVMQRPPAFSAMKVGGHRAYALARKGKVVELEPRPVTIHSIELMRYEWPFADLDIRSGKGVYIRSLARDLGVALGTGGSLAALRRTAVGRFTIDRATRLDDLPTVLTQADLLPVEAFVDDEGQA